MELAEASGTLSLPLGTVLPERMTKMKTIATIESD